MNMVFNQKNYKKNIVLKRIFKNFMIRIRKQKTLMK